MQIIRAADRIWTPWKNGGGRTSELAVHPPGASLDNFGWRASIAEVQSDGPFSCFPGTDRHLTVISGCLRLSLAGRDPVILEGGDHACGFAGDAKAYAEVPDGPVTDFNIMAKRGQFSAALRNLPAGTREVLRISAAHILLLATGEAICGTMRLGPLDAVVIDGMTEKMAIAVDSGWLHIAEIGSCSRKARV